MLPLERFKRIKELLQEHDYMKISDLSKTLGVSEMTIHRDLKPLVDEGYIMKTFGGVVRVQSLQKPSQHQCIYCHREVQGRLAYRLILSHTVEETCCAHCGLLRHRQLGEQVEQALCHDFLRQTTISALQSWYVLDTSLDLGCCQPQVLVFEWKEHAEKFVKGFGGTVHPFQEATRIVFEKMNVK